MKKEPTLPNHNAKCEFLIGVDGGGTKTHVRITDKKGVEIAQGTAGPSALMHGIEKAWEAIQTAVDAAFSNAKLSRPLLKDMAAGLGLSGVHNKQWADEFARCNPGFCSIAVETDAFTTLLGAHQGQPGAIVATGTGSVGEALLKSGERREVGGWGFPAGDEASGAWIGLKAIGRAQQVLDGREKSGSFAQAVITACGGNRDGLFAWLARATQTTYAQLAPLVIEYASADSLARDILVEAGKEVEKMANALDHAGQLPIALCGGLAEPLMPYLPETLTTRLVKPNADSASGALLLIRRRLDGTYDL